MLGYLYPVIPNRGKTHAQLAGERDRRLAEVDAQLAQARKVQTETGRQLERLDSSFGKA
jgi:hypothetical protein